VRVRLPLSPLPAPRPRVTSKGWTYYPRRYKEWREAAAALFPEVLAELGLDEPLDGALTVSVDFAVTRPKKTKLPYPKPDLDNYLKSVLDVGTAAGLWIDDHRIIHLEAAKRWAPHGEQGYIDIIVKRLGEWG
jgi:Holliday junction resolvase RusA-like endonuclease